MEPRGYCSCAGGSSWCLGPGWRPGATWEPRPVCFLAVFPFVHFRAQHSPLQEVFWSCSLFSSDPKIMGGSSHAEGGSE